MRLVYNHTTKELYSIVDDQKIEQDVEVLFTGTEISFNKLKELRVISELPKKSKQSLITLLTYRCRAETISRITGVVKYSLSLIEYYGILNRLVLSLEDMTFHYTAGQSYPDEIRTLRKIFM